VGGWGVGEEGGGGGGGRLPAAVSRDDDQVQAGRLGGRDDG